MLGQDLLVDDQLHRRRPWTTEMHDYRIIPCLLDGFQGRNQAFARGSMRLGILDGIFLNNAVECKDYIIRGHECVIVKSHPSADSSYPDEIKVPGHLFTEFHV